MLDIHKSSLRSDFKAFNHIGGIQDVFSKGFDQEVGILVFFEWFISFLLPKSPKIVFSS